MPACDASLTPLRHSSPGLAPQNTPYPMVIARIKTLLSRLSLLLAPPWERQQSSRLGSRPGSPEQPQVWQASSRPSTPPTEAMARRSSNCSSLEGQSRTESQGSGFRRSATMLQRQQSQPPTPGSPSKAATLGALQELSFVLRWGPGGWLGMDAVLLARLAWLPIVSDAGCKCWAVDAPVWRRARRRACAALCAGCGGNVDRYRLCVRSKPGRQCCLFLGILCTAIVMSLP